MVTGAERLSAITVDERLALSHTMMSGGYRLGCRAELLEDGEVVLLLPSESRLGVNVLLSEGHAELDDFDPGTSKVEVRLGADFRSPSTNSLAFLGGDRKGYRFSEQARARLSEGQGAGEERTLFLVVRQEEVLDARQGCRLLGFSVDVGTTKVAGHLVDLEDGRTLSTVAEINPQIAYGEDVISRLAFALGGGAEQLQSKIVSCVNDLMERACSQANVSPTDIYEMVVVGNSVMHHLFAGLELKSLAYFPYAPATTGEMELPARQVGLTCNGEANLLLPPLIAGYVGADAVADIVATRMYEGPEPSILVDIGTNTEVVVQKEGRLLTCSTASGPAFEGAHIRFGMRAATGAIDRIELSNQGVATYTVIGNARPRGMTGSAVVDALAELLRVGLLDRSGRLPVKGEGRVRTGPDGYTEYLVVPESESKTNVPITLSQKDIREIQLAKAAIRTGLNILMDEAGLTASEVGTLHIAGAFGFFLNPLSAEAIGLYPDIDVRRIRLVGNTALAGARALLLSTKTRRTAVDLAKRVEHVELARHKKFKEEFMKSIPLSRT